MSGHRHDSGVASQNLGNTLGSRSCVRQSKLYRQYESGNDVKAILGTSHLCWRTDQKEGAYKGQKVYDHDKHNTIKYMKQTFDNEMNIKRNDKNYRIDNYENSGNRGYYDKKYPARNQDYKYSSSEDVRKFKDYPEYEEKASYRPLQENVTYARNEKHDSIKERMQQYIQSFEQMKQTSNYDNEYSNDYQRNRYPQQSVSQSHYVPQYESNNQSSNHNNYSQPSMQVSVKSNDRFKNTRPW